MKYFIDTEFIEGTQNKTFLGFNVGKTKPTIDLISIGIVAEDGLEYYAISKDFNLKEAWNRYDIKAEGKFQGGFSKKVYWIRENVLRPIFEDLVKLDKTAQYRREKVNVFTARTTDEKFTLENIKILLAVYGKANKQIAEEVIDFCKQKPVFYAYYADYDWVVFCWMFGKMNDLPNGFPYYCRDLKQIADDIWEKTGKETRFESPKGEHNALVDARWNLEFYKFLESL